MGVMIINGKQTIDGTVTISGAKNSATKILAASLLSDKEVVLQNFPEQLEDVKEKMDILKDLGAIINCNDGNVNISINKLSGNNIRKDCGIRTTYLLAPIQLHREGRSKIPYPGGCKIGDRKYDLHIMVWEKMGCLVDEKDDYIEIKCKKNKLYGARIDFPFPTIGGTENALMCAVLAEGETVIHNAYVSPEVEDLIVFLKSMGAEIRLHGNSCIIIQGVKSLNGTSHRIIPDRIEALTWMIACVLTEGRLMIKNVPFDFMEVPLIHLKHIGLDYFRNSDSLFIDTKNVKCYINPFEVACGTYPGVITDMQPFFSVLATQATGTSRIIDYRYPERFGYLAELKKMGCKYITSHGEAVIYGKANFVGARVRALDLRGGASILLAALIAEGETEIENYKMILRGYNGLFQKLKDLSISYCLCND